MPKLSPIPRIVRPLPLSEYAPELKFGDQPAVLHVWVNPPRDVLIEHDVLALEAAALMQAVDAARTTPPPTQEERDALSDSLAARTAQLSQARSSWFATLWSQHPDPATHWSVEEVQAVADLEEEPGLFLWMTEQSMQMIADHRSSAQKK